MGSNIIISLSVTALIILVSILLLNNNTSFVNRVVQPKNDKQLTSRNPATICRNDSECVIKELFNCDIFYETCVNKDYVQDLEAKKRSCEKIKEFDPRTDPMPPLAAGGGPIDCDCRNAECINIYR